MLARAWYPARQLFAIAEREFTGVFAKSLFLAARLEILGGRASEGGMEANCGQPVGTPLGLTLVRVVKQNPDECSTRDYP